MQKDSTLIGLLACGLIPRVEMFGITSAYRFLEKVRADYASVEADIADSGAVLNCILSLCHLHEWVWARCLKQRPEMQAQLAQLGICRDNNELIAWLDANCPPFGLLQKLANGTNHCRLVHFTEHVEGYGCGPFGIGRFGVPKVATWRLFAITLSKWHRSCGEVRP